MIEFQSAHPVRGATAPSNQLTHEQNISIHAPRAGCDQIQTDRRQQQRQFQSTHPVRGATSPNPETLAKIAISIHAPRAGCDQSGYELFEHKDISIHAPRAGCDPIAGYSRRSLAKFQSTRPVWGATAVHIRDGTIFVFQSTRPVWGATTLCVRQQRFCCISIHAPRVGRDAIAMPVINISVEFQSTRPVWGATTRWRHSRAYGQDFNPRAPCGARPNGNGNALYEVVFQSTRPVWGAT